VKTGFLQEEEKDCCLLGGEQNKLETVENDWSMNSGQVCSLKTGHTAIRVQQKLPFLRRGKQMPQRLQGLEGTASPGATAQATRQAQPLTWRSGATHWEFSSSAQAQVKETEQEPRGSAHPASHRHLHAGSFHHLVDGSGLGQPETTQDSGR